MKRSDLKKAAAGDPNAVQLVILLSPEGDMKDMDASEYASKKIEKGEYEADDDSEEVEVSLVELLVDAGVDKKKAPKLADAVRACVRREP